MKHAMKFDAEKPRLDLLDPHAIEQLANVLTFGAQKYEAHNWRKGLSKCRLIAAALRHLFAYLNGEDIDAESGLSHVAHAMCCCMFLLGLESRADLDDRYRAPAQIPPAADSVTAELLPGHSGYWGVRCASGMWLECGVTPYPTWTHDLNRAWISGQASAISRAQHIVATGGQH